MTKLVDDMTPEDEELLMAEVRKIRQAQEQNLLTLPFTQGDDLSEIDQEFEVMKAHVHGLLNLMGYSPASSEHFLDTPRRVAKYLLSFRKPDYDIAEILGVQFESSSREMVMVRAASFTSMCAHHMLPFYGTANIAYLPAGKIVGVSKLVRALRYYAHRPTVQEEITTQLADAIEQHLSPDCMVILQGVHECMKVRGVEDPNADMVTSAARGKFLDNDAGLKDEFLALIRNGHR